jgi:large subunit ribosomal protein L24
MKKKQAPPPRKIKFRTGDIVKVITGRDVGKSGRILSIDRKRGKLLVEGVMMAKRHTRPNPAKQIKGGIAEREASIDVSNVMIMTSGGVASRIGYRVDTVAGKQRRTRVARKTGEALEKKA